MIELKVKSFQQIMIGLVVTLIALILQSTLLKFFLPSQFIPNICLIFVLFLAFYEVSIVGAVLTFLVGLLFDVNSGVLLGPWSAAFSATFCVLSLLSRRIFLDSFLASSLLAFASGVFATAIYLGFLYQFQHSVLDITGFLTECLVTALIAPFFLFVFKVVLVRKWPIYAQRNISSV
ncbi:MAG: rod shape-determining protein MreD [SAR324 cluster bacterium]|uniref:Rod shape-determining protein MreD n=1 Tax=SAR324 cluster bacterium TaxID=2024889 RepID=A0A7X9FRQ2_9DELT|nr:rod shape-determining protein MreD [SAR324 cluster bacterium]